MKKTFVLLGITLLVLSVMLMTSCEESTGVPPSEVYRFTYTHGWGTDQGAIPPSEAPNDPHFQYVEKVLKTVPLTQPYEWGGGVGYVEQVRLQISSGNMPEALQLFGDDFTNELIQSDALVALDDLLPKYAPEAWKMFTQNEWDLIRSYSTDGKIYFLPTVDFVPRIGLIRKDWLKEVGIDKVPETPDELLAVYKAFAEKDANGNGDANDEIPTSGRAELRWLDDQFVMWGVSMTEGFPEWRWDDAKKQMICDQVSDEMKNALIWIKKLMDLGYLDKVVPIQPAGDWFAKIENDKVGHYFHTLGGIPRRLAMRASGANPDAEWAYMPNMKVPGVPHQKNYAPGIGGTLAITKAAKDPARILKWYDWAATPEGLKFANFGIEGLNYIEKDGKIVSDDPSVKPVSNKHLYVLRWIGQSRLQFESMPFSENLIAVYDACKDDYRFKDNMMMPATIYDGYEDYIPAKSPLYKQVSSQIVLGQLDISAWDDYVKEWYAKGGTEVTKRATEWYKKVHNIK
jgi:putative aldouronate transport system substrate-binding protein